MDKSTFRTNNFDMLRLFAALQVAINHAIANMYADPGHILKNILHTTYLFSGVPIFFFISGFLISKSYEKNHRLAEYSQNRILRLYPGLIICVAISYILIAISGYMKIAGAGVLDWAVLFISKTTFFQFYNPDFMRNFGDGVLNGSLWTITVEIQFYVLVPIIYSIFKLRTSNKANAILLILIGIFLALNRVYTYIPAEYHTTIPYKLLHVSFLPWFYMFLVGIYVQKNFELFYKILANRFIYVFSVYCILGYFIVTKNIELGNNINPIIFLLLVTTIFSFSYSFTWLNKKILKGNDISYGTYIYHMPVIDFFIYMGYSGKLSHAIYALLIAIALAIVSWVTIERTSLKFKKHPLNPLNRKYA